MLLVVKRALSLEVRRPSKKINDTVAPTPFYTQFSCTLLKGYDTVYKSLVSSKPFLINYPFRLTACSFSILESEWDSGFF